jgi:hypothetical protein
MSCLGAVFLAFLDCLFVLSFGSLAFPLALTAMVFQFINPTLFSACATSSKAIDIDRVIAAI